MATTRAARRHAARRHLDPRRRHVRPLTSRHTCHNAPVKNFLIRVAVNGVALWVAALVVSGVHLGEGDASVTSNIVAIVLVALLFGLINAFIKPIVKLLSLPFVDPDAGALHLHRERVHAPDHRVDRRLVGLPFTIDHFFWDAVFAAVVITLVSWVLNVVLPDDD